MATATTAGGGRREQVSRCRGRKNQARYANASIFSGTAKGIVQTPVQNKPQRAPPAFVLYSVQVLPPQPKNPHSHSGVRIFLVKQTSITKTLYELPSFGWQIKAQIGKTIICDKTWTKIIQIEWEETTVKNDKRTDAYSIKMINRNDEIAALIIALTMYISRRPEYQ